MMSRHFCLSSELTGAIAKRLPHAKNQLSGPDSFFNQFVTDIYIYKYIYIYIYIYSHVQPLINHIEDDISKYVCPAVIIDIARKITKLANLENFDA